MDENKRETFERCIAESHDNQLSILKSERCGCYCCGSVFSARDIVDWDERDGAIDALCPACGMAGVYGDSDTVKIDEKFAEEVKEYARSTLGDGFAASEIKRYCDAYAQGRINRSKTSESLYFSYGLALAFQIHDDTHLMAAIHLIAFGGEYLEPAPEMAISILKRPFFADDAAALTILSSLYSAHKGSEKEATQDKHAYECAYKASLLGGLLGRCYLYDYTYEGTGTKKNPVLASTILFAVIDEVLDSTRGSTRYNNPELFEYFARLGDDCVENENPMYRDAVRFYLLADHFASEVNTPFYEDVRKELAEDLEEAKDKFGAIEGPMMMDEHTFYDTFADYRHCSLPIDISHVEYNDTLQTLSITLAPTSEYILLDASSATYRKVYHEEVSFTLGGVLHIDLPNHPFSFTSIHFYSDTNGNRANFLYGFGDECLVGTIYFQKIEEELEEEEGD
ncbi:MAG: hypothetical protein K6B65_01635 [Bacilli bacterium]|nr:hypothetical protein [Bacilli bacterium]